MFINIMIALWAILLTAYMLEAQEILPDKPYTGTIKLSQVTFYSIKIPAKSKDVLFYMLLNPTGDNTKDPDAYLSNIPFKSDVTYKTESVKNCTSFGEDICPIDGNTLSMLSEFTLYIAISSEGECNYSFVIKNTTISVATSEYTSITVEKDTIKVFAFDVNEKAEKVMVQMMTFGGESVSQNLRMFTAPRVIPNCDCYSRSLQTWNGFYTKLTKEFGSFCSNCTYYVLIFSKANISGSLTMNSTSLVIPFENSSFYVLDSLLSRNDRNCYSFVINETQKNKIITFYVTPFFGNPNLYVNANEIPSEPSKFQFKTEGNWDDYLIITPEQRNNSIGKYYACVYGTFALYDIFSYSLDSLDELYIGDGMTRTMYTQEGVLTTFRYSVMPNETGNVTASLVTHRGNTDLYALQCDSFDKKCTITTDDTKNKSSSILRSENEVGLDQIVVTVKQCAEGCYIIFGVYGRKNNTEYSLTASFDEKAHIKLEENQPTYGYVKPGKYIYYSFYIPPEMKEGIESITIQLTSYSGDADIFLSKKEKYPVIGKNEMYSQMDFYMSDTLFINKPPFDGSYYIGILGHSYSSFSVRYSIKRNVSEPDEKNLIRLVDGHPQSMSVNNSVEPSNFTFFVPNDQAFDIILTPESYSYSVYVDYMPKSKLEDHLWKTDTYLHLDKLDPNYKSETYYYVRVVPNKPLLYFITRPIYRYTLKYATTTRASFLEEGKPSYGKVKKNEYIFYAFQMGIHDSNVSISLTAYSGDPNLFISTNIHNKFPTSMNNSMHSSNVGDDNIKIEWTKLTADNAYCTTAFESCIIYIGVSTAEDESEYMIKISYEVEKKLSMLIDGYPIEDETLKEMLYYIIPSNHTSMVQISHYSTELNVYINKIINGTRVSKSTWEVPTSKSHTHEFYEKGGVYGVKLEGCDACIYLISVSSKQNTRATYSIISTISALIQLEDGVQTLSSIEEHSYIYYKFNVGCSNCTMSISVTPLTTGNPDLYINFGQDTLPTQNSYLFKSNSTKGDFVQISAESEFFYKTNSQNIKGTFIIGVYGETACSFSIIATTSVSQFLTIFGGMPFTIHHKDSQINQILRYNPVSNDSFIISANLQSGGVYIIAKACNLTDSTNIISCVPTSTSFHWSSAGSVNKLSLKIKKEDHNFLSNGGVYLIGMVSSNGESIYSVTVYPVNEKPIFIKLNEPVRLSISKGQRMILSFIIEEQSDIEIYPTVFSGVFKYYLMADINDNESKAIHSSESNYPITFKPSHTAFKKGSTYYLFIDGIITGEFNMLVSSKISIISLTDGVPQKAMLSKLYPSVLLGYEGHPKLNAVSFTISSTGPIVVYITRVISNKLTFFDFPNEQNFNFKYDGYNYMTKQINGVVPFLDSSDYQLILMKVLNAGDENSTIEAILWSQERLTLYSNSRIPNSISNLSAKHIYDISVSKVPAMVEVIPCSGVPIVELYENSKEVKKLESSNNLYLGRIALYISKAGDYFVSVGREAAKMNGSLDYSISLKEDITYSSNANNYHLPDKEVAWKWNGKNLHVQWDSIWLYNSRNVPYNPKNVSYLIYLSNSKTTMHPTACNFNSTPVTVPESALEMDFIPSSKERE